MFIWVEEVMSVLKINQLTATYGEGLVLQGIDLTAPLGKITCLVGRNGVGKSTLLRSIMGLIDTPTGSILLDQQELMKKTPYERARMGIGYVPQGREIFPQLTVYENLLLGLEPMKGKGKIDENIYELFPILKDFLSRKGGDLSGGQQQQLALARALVSHPKILILDEPTEGIQPSIIQDIGRIIKKLSKETQLTIFIVEQYLEFVLEVADYYYVMDKGRIILDGDIAHADTHLIQSKISI